MAVLDFRDIEQVLNEPLHFGRLAGNAPDAFGVLGSESIALKSGEGH